MATFDDLAAVLNNPYTNPNELSLAEAVSALNTPPPEPPTLPEIKSRVVATRLRDKKAKLGQKPVPDTSNIWAGDTLEDTSALDLMESSLLRAGGNVADATRGVSNYLFGTEYDDSADTGYSNQREADEAAGVSLAYRQNLQQDQNKVLEAIADDDYWEAAKAAFNVAGRTAMDSAGVVPELAAGAGLTALGGIATAKIGGVGAAPGLALLGRRAKKAVDLVGDVKDRYDAVKEASLMRKMSDNIVGAMKTAGKSASQASVLTADIVQQQRAAYKEEYGEEPSMERLAGMTLMTLATTAWQPAIASKLYLPKFSKTNAGKTFKEKMQNEIADIVQHAERGVLRNVAGRIGQGIARVGAAGGAEAVQEYGQFWAETLGVHMKPDEVTGLMDAAVEVFKGSQDGKKNTDLALQSAFLGGAAGGATKLGIDAPGQTIGATYDVATGITTATGRFIEDKAQKAAGKVMSATELETKQAEFEGRRAAIKTLEETNIELADSINKAKTINDITDPDMRKRFVDVVGNDPITDPKVFKTAKDAVIRGLKTDVAQAKINLQKDRAVVFGKQAGKAAVEKTKEVAQKLGITEEMVDKAIDEAKVLGTAVKEEIKEFNTSATYGLTLRAMEYGKQESKKGLKAMQEAAVESSPKVIRTLAGKLEKDMPNVARELNKIATDKEAKLKVSKLKTDQLTTIDSMNSKVREYGNIGKVPEKAAPFVGDQLMQMSKGKFDGEQTVVAAQKALKSFMNTAYFKNSSQAFQRTYRNIESQLNQEYKDQRTAATRVKQGAKKAVKFMDPVIVDTVKGAGELTRTMATGIDNAFQAMIDTVNKEGGDKKTETVQLKETKVKVTPGMATFINQVNEQLDNMKGMEPDEAKAATKVLVDGTLNENAIKAIVGMMGETDPDILYGLMGKAFPPLITKENGPKLRQLIDQALGPVDQEPQTDTDVDPDAKPVKPTGKVMKEQDDDNLTFVDGTPPDTDFETWIDEVIGKHNVCGKS